MAALGKNEAFRRELLAEAFPTEWETWLSANVFHYRCLNDAERGRLRNNARVLIAEKNWEGCDGLKVTEMMKLTVSAEAALLLLGLEHDYFSRVLSVVLFPKPFESPPESWQERRTFVAGRAVDYGTVFLSWETVLAEARDPGAGHNLVIHEFAHQLDFLDGYTNGTPVLRSFQQTQRWQEVMNGAFQRLRRDLQMGRKTLLGSYAASRPAEFFSVASERFFSVPSQLQNYHPELFQVLAEYYGVEPLRWFVSPGTCVMVTPPSSPEARSEQEGQPTIPENPPELDFIDFDCPYCRTLISFPKPDLGTLRQCPNCLESMIVPDKAGKSAERLPFPIRTERLLLRRFQPLDAKDLADVLSKPDTLRYLGWQPMSLEEAEEWIGNQSGVPFPQCTD